MVLKITSVITLFVSLIWLSACSQSEEQVQFGSDEVTTLPMNRVTLDHLEDFKNPGRNWTIAGNVNSDFEKDGSMNLFDGEGILVNNYGSGDQRNLFTELEHGDLQLKLEFLVPRGSNSGIYLQGRYELQILDSWKVNDPQFSDVGGIYERWDESRPEGEKGNEGVSPTVNAGIAPGLWQEYEILFRAPRFDNAGQ